MMLRKDVQKVLALLGGAAALTVAIPVGQAMAAPGLAAPVPITNGGFEQVDADGQAVDWETVGSGPAEDVVRSGKRSLRILHTGERKWSHLNRHWEPRSGKQGAMLPVLSGRISFWYQVLSARNANIWLGVIPMSAEPWENTGEKRTGLTVPDAHVGDGLWHQAVVSYDYPAGGRVAWVHVSCFVKGDQADIRLDDIEWVRPEIGVVSLDVLRGNEGRLRARAVVRNTGNLIHKGAVVEIIPPDSLSLAPGEQSSKTIFRDLQPGTDNDRLVEWQLVGSPRQGERLAVVARTRTCAAAAERGLTPSGCVGDLRAAAPRDLGLAVPRRATRRAAAPPTPDWFKKATRVAYTDQSNTSRYSDWPEGVIKDLGKAGVQVLYSRAHSGESWPGVGWRSSLSKSAFGSLVPEDWAGSGVTLTDDDAHEGEHAVRIEHTPGRKESFLIRRWSGRSGRQGALLAVLKGTVSFWYKAVHAQDASIWLGVLPMSADPWENTGRSRTGVTIPKEHVGDGLWHQATVPFDYEAKGGVTWVHVGCFIRGTSAEVLLDDIEMLGSTPQPVTNGGFENLGAGGDRTREVVDLCHQHGIRYLAYFWGMREPPDVWRDHPDWQCLDHTGKPRTGRFCPNNPAYRQFMRDRFAEIITKCSVDGIFIDMHGASLDEGYCKHCVREFRALTGEEPPVAEDFDSLLWQAWIRFKHDTVEEAMLDYNRAIKAANSEAVLVVNSWNAWCYRRGSSRPGSIGTSIRLAETVDALLEELGWYDLDGSFFAFPARFSFMSWHLAGLHKENPAHAWGHPTEWAGGGTTQNCEARIRVMTMITNGATAAHSVPDRRVMAQYMADLAQREPFLRGARLFPWCGLVVSEKTEQWYGRDDPLGRYIKGLYGAFQMMLESHLPVSLVTDRELELGTLESYRVLFIPNCAVMSDAEIATVREFVRRGGGVVATYETSRFDEHAWPRQNLGLADVFGITRVSGSFDNTRAHWLTPPTGRSATLHLSPNHRWSADPVIAERMARGWVGSSPGSLTRALPIHSRILTVGPEHATLDLRTRTWRPRAAGTMAGLTSSQRRALPKEVQAAVHPGLIETTYGKGKVIYLPADISWAFFRYGHAYLARIMELALRDVASEPPPVEVRAPRTVQVMTHRQGRRLVVHLLNDISSFGRSANAKGESMYIRREVIPIHDIRVTFRDRRSRKFQLVPGNTKLSPTPTADGLTVTVPRLDIHTMVVADMGERAPQ